MKFIALITLTICINFVSLSQSQELSLINENGETFNIDSLATSQTLDEYLTILKTDKINAGFLEFSIDSISRDKKTILVFIGKQYYEGGILYNQETSLSQPSNSHLNTFDIKKINQEFEFKLKQQENNGFPFTEIHIDQINIIDTTISIIVNIKQNQLVKIDSLVIKSKNNIDQKIISKIIGINKGDLYNEQEIKDITKLLSKSKFYKDIKKTELLFTNEGAQLFLHLDKLSTNKFEGILGVQPGKNNQKTSITGEIQTQFANNFQKGESFSFEWRKLPSQTQELKITASYPYIAFSNFGLIGNIDIYKQDTTFISTERTLGTSYRISINEEISVFAEQLNSFDQKNLNETAATNSKSTAIGVKYIKNNFNNLINPTKGYSIKISHSAGTRKTTNDLEKSESNQHRSKIEFQKIIPIVKRVNALFKIQEEFQTGGSQFQNELIRFGGFKTLRGFDELTFRATTFIAASLEFRFLLDANSNIHLFGDYGWYEQNSNEGYIKDTPFGIGTGISFSTKSGVFSFDYAIGSQLNNPFDFRTGKIHFGIRNLF